MKFNYWQTLEYNCHYHIYNRTVNQELLFRDDSDHKYLLEKVGLYLFPFIEVFAYCLLPNHFHFIIKVRSEKEVLESASRIKTNRSQAFQDGKCLVNDLLADQMRCLFSSYAIKYNNKYRRKGTLLAPKMKRIFIENDDRLRYLIAYVHHNPIHHNLKGQFKEWRYSSFNSLLSKGTTRLSRDEIIKLYGNRNSFQEYHDTFKLEKIEEEAS